MDGPIWAPYGHIWSPYGPIWAPYRAHMGPYGPIWPHIGPYGIHGPGPGPGPSQWEADLRKNASWKNVTCLSVIICAFPHFLEHFSNINSPAQMTITSRTAPKFCARSRSKCPEIIFLDLKSWVIPGNVEPWSECQPKNPCCSKGPCPDIGPNFSRLP